VDVDLTGVSALKRGASITISNSGDDALLMPAVFLSGRSALNRFSVLNAIQSPAALSDEQFALATWKFVTQNTGHYCSAGSTADSREMTMDPMRMLYGYGFTCCDQSSRILSWLWQGAGYQTRIAQMTFHTVPEIYYGGAWHMYDGDHRVYYLAQDNTTVANVAQIIADPALVARVADANGNDPAGFSAQTMANLYAVAVPSYLYDDLTAVQTYSLQPNQSFSMQYKYDQPTFYGPILYPFGETSTGYGQFDWSLDYSKSNWSQLPYARENVTTVSDGGDVFLSNSGRDTGYAVYELSSPFPVIALQVSGIVYRSNSNASVNAYLSTDGVQWSAPYALDSSVGSAQQASVDLSEIAKGQYSYFVKLELKGYGLETARIAAVHITSEVQESYFLFPKLTPGVVNHLTYQDFTSASSPHAVSVALQLD
jgi:hypothetical protein